jgi:hypothetical protein
MEQQFVPSERLMLQEALNMLVRAFQKSRSRCQKILIAGTYSGLPKDSLPLASA